MALISSMIVAGFSMLSGTRHGYARREERRG
jgi:hypothetical protein